MPSILSNLRLGGTDENGNAIDARPADLMAKISVILAALFTVLYIIEAILLGVVPNLNDINKISWYIAPGFSIALLITTIVFGIITNPIGVYGAFKLNRTVSRVHFYLSMLLFALNLVVFVYLLMSGNGIVATGRRTNGNDIDGKVGINSFADDTQANIVRFSQDHEDTWKRIQNTLNSGCCGLNVQALYADQVFGIKDFSLSDLNSGEQCIAGNNGLATFLADNQNFTDETIANANQNALFSSTNFFCERFLASEIKGLGQSFGVLLGLQTFFQLVLMILFGLLIYAYEQQEGGMKPDEDPLDAKPRVENTVAMRAGYQTNKTPAKGRKGVNATQGRKAAHFA